MLQEVHHREPDRIFRTSDMYRCERFKRRRRPADKSLNDHLVEFGAKTSETSEHLRHSHDETGRLAGE